MVRSDDGSSECAHVLILASCVFSSTRIRVIHTTYNKTRAADQSGLIPVRTENERKRREGAARQRKPHQRTFLSGAILDVSVAWTCPTLSPGVRRAGWAQDSQSLGGRGAERFSVYPWDS